MSEGTGNALPSGWAIASLGDTVDVIRGVTYRKEESRKEAADGFVPVLRANNIGEELNFDSLVYAPERDVSDVQRLRRGDIVVAASSGSASLVGKGAQLRAEWDGACGAFCFALRPVHAVDHRYLGWFVHTKEYRNRVSKASGGVNINNLRAEHIEQTPLRVPPLGEQARIADALDELLSDLDAGVRALTGVQVKLRQYRAAVLKAAVEGTLTADWRKAHADVEPAAALLQRILAERRRRWEEAKLNKYKDVGKEPPKNWRNAYPEPTAPDLTGLPTLPNCWDWASLEQMASLAGGVTKGQKFRPNELTREVPYLRVANVQRGYLDLAEVKTIRASEDDIQELTLVPGDVLFNEGGDRDKLGRGWIWEGQIKQCIHQNHVFRARLLLEALSPKLVSWCGNSYGQAWFSRTGKQSVNLASINLAVLRSFPVPVVPLDEQEQIVELVDDQLSIIDHVESDLEAKLKSAEALRQSILKAAFEGKLVPQDPNDEPASELLKRIAAERAERGLLAKEAKKAMKPAKTRKSKRGQNISAVSAG